MLPLPAAIRYEDAAAFILVNMTAWRMLVTQARLRAGEDLLIIGVGGGVSSTAVQIGKLCGARVWVTSSSDEKLERARALGADECINYAKEDWVKVIGQKTGQRGVDVVLENVGAATWKGAIRTVAKGGRIVTCGATSGPIARDRHPARVLEAALDHRLDDVERRRVQHGHGPALRGAAAGHRGHGDAAQGRRRGAAAPRGGQAVRQDRPHALSFRLVVVADWSAASTRGPVRPARDRCWVAWGRAGESRPAPRYFRTRLEAEGFILGLLVGEPGAALVGFDFAFGYPADARLPAGRALCAKLDGLIRDEADGANNRFEVAGSLNREIQAAFGGGFEGPFWGHPAGHAYPHLSATRPRPFPPRISDGRLVERRLASRRIQSPWKLFTRASVGSQTLLGLPAVHRLLTDPRTGAARAALALRDRVGRGGRATTAS